MSLISLPYALLVEVSEHLYLADSLAHYFDGQSIRLVRLHHGYRILCATNRRLRTMFLHKLYESVFLQLRRAYLQAQTDSIMEFFRFLETHGIIQLIRKIRLCDAQKSAYAAMTYRLHPRMSGMSPKEDALLYRILQRIFFSASNLDSLNMSEIEVPLTEEVVMAINAHACLQTVTLANVHQAKSLPEQILSMTSISRLHFHKLTLTDEAASPFPILRTILAGGSDSPSIHEVTISPSFDSDWTSLVFNNLEKLHVEWTNTKLAPFCGAFLARHNQVKDIDFSGTGLHDLRSIANIPILSSLYEGARNDRLLHSFWLDQVSVTNGDCQYPSALSHLRNARICVTQRPAEVISFLLDTLPACDELQLVYEPKNQEIMNFLPLTTLWETVISHSSSLQHLRALSLSKFPLWDDPQNPPFLRFHRVLYSGINLWEEVDDEDYEVPPELWDLGDNMKVFVGELSEQCPKLSEVHVGRPEMAGEAGRLAFRFSPRRSWKGSQLEGVDVDIYEPRDDDWESLSS